MFDLHYDLLTYILMNKNDLAEVKKHCQKIFDNNIKGGIFNLFYMSPKEMKEELNIEYKDIDIIENLQTVNRLIKQYNLIPKGIKYIYGIEGLDYLKDIEDLEIIRKIGVKSVNIVWNNDNKFGGGVRGDEKQGLTALGEKLVKKLLKLNIAIDLSHANEKTFYDIIYMCKKLKKYNPIVFASHSNSKTLCKAERNLSDDQILKIKELGGIIGIVGIKQFCTTKGKNVNEFKNEYIKHINYLKDLLGDVKNISVSTDDMTYYKINSEYYQNTNVFKQENVKKEIENLLTKEKYSKVEIKNILYKNFKSKILQRL